MNYKSIWRPLIFALLLLFLGLFYAQKINLTTADLGRHIKNGEVFFKGLRPISTNFYSYTQPDRPTINHHWGAGVIFYLLWRWIGFKGISIFYIFLHLFTFFLFFRIAEKKSNFTLALLFSVLSLPLITNRTEIRPEGFSYLMLGIYFYLLNSRSLRGDETSSSVIARGGSTRSNLFFQRKTLWVIPILQILWVNLHIFFIMGPFLIGIFLVGSWISTKDKGLMKQYTVLLFGTIAACFINPFGLKGALTPLTIFKEYGYMIVENQSVIFMQNRFPHNPVYFHFEILFLITLISFVFIILKKGVKHHIIGLLLMVSFSALSWNAIRGFPILGLFFIPIVSRNFHCLTKNTIWKYIIALIPLLPIIATALLLRTNYYSPFKGKTGLGLMPGVQSSASFFKQNQLHGPIFNNYDIGSYLIYHLFPRHKVFVDNRPEAYSVSFFKDTYIPMQEDEKVWERMDNQYNFNAIYFYRHDMTPWAQPFLIQRIGDPKWAPVFVDDYSLILLKRNIRNERLIRLYELPRGIFKIR